MKLYESGEMYLETILRLSHKQSTVRSIDIVNFMNFSKPSVSKAVHQLKNSGYIDIDSNGFITLTEKGRLVAEDVYKRHVALSELFMLMGVEEKIAVEDACKVEHYISDTTFEAILKHIENLKIVNALDYLK